MARSSARASVFRSPPARPLRRPGPGSALLQLVAQRLRGAGRRDDRFGKPALDLRTDVLGIDVRLRQERFKLVGALGQLQDFEFQHAVARVRGGDAQTGDHAQEGEGCDIRGLLLEIGRGRGLAVSAAAA